jgi:hypothetical protein
VMIERTGRPASFRFKPRNLALLVPDLEGLAVEETASLFQRCLVALALDESRRVVNVPVSRFSPG